LNEENSCTLKGIFEERDSEMFIPLIKNVNINSEEGERENISFEVEGEYLIGCNLNFEIISEIDEVMETLIENKNFSKYKNESFIIGKIPKKK